MEKCLAFVLGGGGARGSFQVGALRALHEAGIQPDLLVGSSIGAVNAAALALWGFDEIGLFGLELAYDKVAASNMLDTNLTRLALQAVTGRLDFQANRKAADFLVATGITPDLTFGQVEGLRLAIIGADLDEGAPVIYGLDPDESILDAVLASMAIPPWFSPVVQRGHLIMDGGALSIVPIEPAMRLGATEIIALNIVDPGSISAGDSALFQFANKLVNAVSRRQLDLELELAAARGVPVHHLHLHRIPSTAIYDFSTRKELMQIGHDMTAAWIPTWYHPGP